MADLPSTARVVIIGGGAVGCSVLYHLAKAGWTDCLLVEKNELTSGSTWHAAGNCPNFVGSWTMMALQNYSTRLYATLGDDVGYPMNYHVTGSVRLAHSSERMDEFAHVTSMARHMDIGLELMTNEDLKHAYPFLETHDLEGGLWDPTDGDIDPAQLSQALAHGARGLGAKVVRFCPVTGVRREGGEWVVETEKGDVRCEYVVNAAGYRAREIGAMFGRDVPCVSLAHQYLITEEIAELQARDTKLPLLRDPDSSYYLRQEKNGLLLGPYEYHCKAHWVTDDDPMPDDFSFQLYPDDLDRLEWYINDACERVPILGSVGITRVVNGPIPYAPDGNPLIGPMPGVPNAFEACVFTFGIVQAGGAGKILCEWITEGETETEAWAVDPRRFTDHVTQEYTRQMGIQVYSHEYATHYPKIQWPAGRPAKTSPVYEALKAKGAEFGAYGGWERADWFPGDGDPRGPATSYDHQHWFERIGAECRHVAEHVGVLDLPGFSRFEVSGPGAANWLDGLITGKLPRPGRIGLVYFSTPKGKVLTEMTLTRFEEDRFWLLTGAGAYWHDQDWLMRHLPDDGAIKIDDITNRWATLLVTGPKSRDVMKAVAPGDYGANAFPWLTHRPAEIAMARGHLIRVSYAGELGWEVHVPTEYALQTYRAIEAAGQDHGICDFGMLALESMRLEKGYRSWKADLSTDFTVLQSGLDRWIHLSKSEFIGKAAIAEEQARGVDKAFVTMTVEAGDGDPVSLSTVFNGDGAACGLVLSAGYGHRTQETVALSILDADKANPDADFEIEVVGTRRKARIHPTAAVYDPNNDRLRG
ncbi:MAG: FAD-dependent oxidoreductase [Pseudomonadota bacterium]